MGTRGLTKVIYQKETRIAQYGQWDHYPSGQGVTISNFLRERVNTGTLNDFKESTMRCRFIGEGSRKEKEMNEFLKKIGCDGGWMTMAQAEKYKEKYPQISRDLGGKILEFVYNQKGSGLIYLYDQSEFLNDKVFCEWAYIIDLDKETLDVMSGYEVVKSFNINELPMTETQFVEMCGEIAE
jgi:hypothetical protein